MIPIPQVVSLIKSANQSLAAGTLSQNNQEFLVEVGGFIQNAEDLGNIVVGVWEERPVYLKDIAKIAMVRRNLIHTSFLARDHKLNRKELKLNQEDSTEQ